MIDNARKGGPYRASIERQIALNVMLGPGGRFLGGAELLQMGRIAYGR